MRTFIAALVGALVLSVSSSVPAYVPNTIDFTDGEAVVTHWPDSAFPIPIRVTPGLTTDINDGSDRAALESALASWNNVQGSSAAVVIEREQDVEAGQVDGINAVEFSNDPALDGAQFVALTFKLTNDEGRILESDMLINDREIGFTTSGGANTGLDLETAMLKEFGKFLGLANSPVGGFNSDQEIDETSAVMYSLSRGIGETARALQPDDIAGIHVMYPAPGTNLGSISGTITRGGQPVFGAHVIAYDPVDDRLIGALTLPDGTFHIGGLAEGRYLMEVLPLAGPASPATIGGIYLRESVDTSFQRKFFDITVRLAAGQSASGLTLEVS
jgi:hypothetical protein